VVFFPCREVDCVEDWKWKEDKLGEDPWMGVENYF
jgi:hypothetical protein